MSNAVSVRNLTKSFGKIVAVNDVSFDVAIGEIFCLVGPNGAGKTTTVECIEGQQRCDTGTVRVCGQDPHASGNALRKRIGVQLQEANLPDRIKVWEALDLFGSFYPSSLDYNDLLEQLGLSHKRTAFFGKLSGGEKQRVFVALALINDPDVVFLDEITTGLDPHARHNIWGLIRSIRDRGKTVVLTTHFMDEAETLADRVAIMNRGRIVALDAPQRLIDNAGLASRISMTIAGQAEVAPLRELQGVTAVDYQDNRITVTGQGGQLVSRLVRTLEDQCVDLVDFRMERPTLEDVFLSVTRNPVHDDVEAS